MPAARRRHPRFLAIFGRLFDRLPVRISTSDLHHRILRKKIYHIRAYDFGVQFSFKPRTRISVIMKAMMNNCKKKKKKENEIVCVEQANENTECKVETETQKTKKKIQKEIKKNNG